MIPQRSVGRLRRLLNALMYRAPQTIPLLSWPEYRTQLYEEGVDRHVLDHIESQYHKTPKDFLAAIHDGAIPAYVFAMTDMASLHRIRATWRWDRRC